MILGILAVLMTVLAQSAAADLGPTNPATGQYVDPDARLGNTTGWRPGVFMVGDSITWRSYSRLDPKVSWEITAYPGRTIGGLAGFLADRRSNRSPIRKVVVALGTNATPGYRLSDLRRDLRMLPKGTAVVFVTPFRDPAHWDRSRPDYWNPRYGRAYAWAMRRIAKHRPHTCVADWAKVARAHPKLLKDGIHPGRKGTRLWIRLVVQTTTKCS